MAQSDVAPVSPEFEIGNEAVVKLGILEDDNKTTVLKEVQTYLSGFKISEQVGNEEITTFNALDNAKKIAYLLNHMTFSFDAKWDKPAGWFWRQIGRMGRKRVKVPIEFYPSGTAVGSEKITCTILIGSRERGVEFGGVDKGSFAAERSGTVVETVVV
jgi:hypothetical protein